VGPPSLFQIGSASLLKSIERFLMSEYPLQSFIDLISFDQVTYTLEDEIEQEKKDVQNLKQSQADFLAQFDIAKKRMQDAKKEVSKAELEMKELEGREREEKLRLEGVKNQKEYRSVQKEIEALKKKQHDYEETLLIAWNKFESAKNEHDVQKSECETKIKEINSEIEQKQGKQGALLEDLKRRKAERELKVKSIPEEWLEKYVLMRSRVSNPVVPVIDGNCTACFYNLPPQDLLELKRNKMLQCKGCYRFLYVGSSE